MKKLFLLGLAFLLMPALVFANGAPETNVDNSLQEVLDKGVFVLGLDDAFPPMGFRNADDEIVGFDIDLATEVTKRLGVELKCQPIDWNSKEQELSTGNIDCIWNGFSVSEERKKVIQFSQTYLENFQILVVKGDSKVQSKKDLVGKVVGLQGGSTSQDALESDKEFENSLKQVVQFKDNMTALMDLETGGVDAVLMDMVVANYNIQQTEKNFRILPDTFTKEDYAVGFRKSDTKLAEAVNNAFEAMKKDGTMAEIRSKWFKNDIK